MLVDIVHACCPCHWGQSWIFGVRGFYFWILRSSGKRYTKTRTDSNFISPAASRTRFDQISDHEMPNACSCLCSFSHTDNEFGWRDVKHLTIITVASFGIKPPYSSFWCMFLISFHIRFIAIVNLSFHLLIVCMFDSFSLHRQMHINWDDWSIWTGLSLSPPPPFLSLCNIFIFPTFSLLYSAFQYSVQSFANNADNLISERKRGFKRLNFK